MQVTQQIYVAEEWVKNSREEINAEVQSRLAAEKAAGVLKQEKDSLADKVKEAIQAWDSAVAGLKTTEKQAKDRRQKLHVTEINLATEKQAVLDLKAQLQRAEGAAWVAREVAEATVKASYERGVLDTEVRLTEEVAVVCRDYCTESWGVVMDRAGVPADSELRRVENIFFPEDIQEIPNSDTTVEKLLSAQVVLPNANTLGGEGVDGQAQQPAKDKPSEDSLTIRDVVS